MDEACATCAQYLRSLPPQYTPKSEKSQHQSHDRRLECCSRIICRECIRKNERFGVYCPFCQISTTPSPLPQGLRDPPSYTISSPSHPTTSSSIPQSDPSNDLPPYTPAPHLTTEKSSHSLKDTLHFLNHQTDTLPSLSLRYKVPISILRRANKITSDHLLLARRTIAIPGEYYQGESLSPTPVEGEEEERKKVILRKWMVGCKVSEYDVALLYLKEANYDLEVATVAYKDDERWEKEHPLEASLKAKGKIRHDIGRRRFTGQKP